MSVAAPPAAWPRVCVAEPGVSRLGEVLAVAGLARLTLDPWQELACDVLSRIDPDGRWVHPEGSVWVPRQNGKGVVIEALMLHRLFGLGCRTNVWSAHQHRTASEGFERFVTLVEGSPALKRRVQAIRRANGEQRVVLKDGATVHWNTRSRSALRGFAVDGLLVLDEGQELTETEMAAIAPTVSAQARSVPGPQVVTLGTPPYDGAAWAYALREPAPGRALLDWGLDLVPDALGLYDPDDLDDRDGWRRANPALGGRITEAAVARERATLGTRFAAERLGVWPPRLDAAGTSISRAAWDALADPPAVDPAVMTGLVLAVDVAEDRSGAVIWAGGTLADGRLGVCLLHHERGTAWVPLQVQQLRQRRAAPVVVDVRGPGATLTTGLAAVGLDVEAAGTPDESDALIVPSSSDVAVAWGWLVDAVRDRGLAHDGQRVVADAVAHARTRTLAGGRAWARVTPGAELVTGATLAAWAARVRAAQDLDVDPDAVTVW